MIYALIILSASTSCETDEEKGFEAQLIWPQLNQQKETILYSVGVLAYNFTLSEDWDLKPSLIGRTQ